MDIDSAHVVLVALDLSPSSEEAFVTARKLVHARHGTLHLLHVLAGDLEAAFAEDRLQQWAEQMSPSVLAGVDHQFHTVRAASPAAAIVQKAAELNVDLIVVGTAGRRGLSRLVLGSVAEEVARTAGCAVLIARAKAHES